MAIWEIDIKTDDIQPYCNVENLKEEDKEFPNYALCLPRYSKLDGGYQNVSKIDDGNIGYMSKSLSNGSGEFQKPPSITLSFARKKTSEGIQFKFNEHSNDYISELKIEWFRYGKLIESKVYHPNSSDYRATADIGMFDKAVITFLKTDKPYRYCWVSVLENYRLTQSEGLKIIYHDIAYNGKKNTTISAFGMALFGETQSLLKEEVVQHPYYASALPNYSKLDGNFINVPTQMKGMGYVSTEISNENGVLSGNSIVVLNVSERISSVGVELRGNNASGDYADHVKVSWFNDNDLLHEEEFHPNAVKYVCEHQQDNYNKVIIVFLHTNKPYRRAYLSGFEHGTIRVFDRKEIVSASCFQDISPLSTEISINTLDWGILNETGMNFATQKRQRVDLIFDKATVGVFYIESWQRNSSTKYNFKARDAISLLDEKDHSGGIYSNALAAEIITDIFDGEEAEVTIDDALLSARISGYLPFSSKRNNLAQICFAIGAIVDTSFDDKVFIYPYEQKEHKLVPKNLTYANSVAIKNEIQTTGIRITSHSYQKSNQEEQTLFDEVLNGEKTIIFNTPVHDLRITGGSIIDSGVNFARINGAGNKVTVYGHEYVHGTQIHTKENPNAYRDKKYKEIQSATLVNSSNVQNILDRVYAYYSNPQSLKADVILDDLELADWVKFDTFEGIKKGIIQSVNMKFTNEIRAEVNMKCI